MSDSFLANVQVEGAFVPETGKTDEQVKEVPAESPTENTQTEKSPSHQGEETKTEKPPESNTDDANNLPFNRNPRWIKMQEEREQLRSTVDSLQKTVEDLQTKIPEKVDATPSVTIPRWFTDLYGENMDAYLDYKKHIDAEFEARERMREEQEKQKRNQEEQDTIRWNDWVKTSIQKIEDRFDVTLKEGSSERNEFIAYILKIKPTDDDGNIDLLKGYEEYAEKQELKKLREAEKDTARKTIADTTASSSRGEPQKSDFQTAKQLRHKSFRDLIR